MGAVISSSGPSTAQQASTSSGQQQWVQVAASTANGASNLGAWRRKQWRFGHFWRMPFAPGRHIEVSSWSRRQWCCVRFTSGLGMHRRFASAGSGAGRVGGAPAKRAHDAM